MQSVAFIGVLYLYAMLVIIVVGMGGLLMRGLDRFVGWIRTPAAAGKKNQETGWVRVIFISGLFLFFSLYSLGVLKAVGAGGEHNHEEHAAGEGNVQSGHAAPPAGTMYDVSGMNRQLDEIERQLLYFEAMMNRQSQTPY